jgi:hypothetical protein
VTEAQQRRARAQFGKIFKVAIHCVRTSLQGVDEHISARAHAKSTAPFDPLFLFQVKLIKGGRNQQFDKLDLDDDVVARRQVRKRSSSRVWPKILHLPDKGGRRETPSH